MNTCLVQCWGTGISSFRRLYSGRHQKLRILASNKGGFGETPGIRNPSQSSKVSKRGKSSSRTTPEQLLKQSSQEVPPSPPQQGGKTERDDDFDDLSDETVPSVVTDRMLKRIIVFAGLPVFLGLTLLPLFYYLKVKQDIDLPSWVVYSIQSVTWGGGLAGISYGLLSASWEPRREGSALGWQEFQSNLPLVMDRFRSNKE